jgi:uncharacterized membrane protein YgcG
MNNKFARFAALALTPVLLFGAPMLARAATPTVVEAPTVISQDQAIAIARAALNTTSPVRDVESEMEHGLRVYKIKFANGMRARVDADSGEVVRTRGEQRDNGRGRGRDDRPGDDRRATPAVPATPARNGQPATPATPAVPAPRVDDGAHNSSGAHVETEVHGNPGEVVHGGGNGGGNSGGGNSGRGNSGGGNSGRR